MSENENRAAELTGRAEQVLDRLTDEHGIPVTGSARTIARMMWLEGYRAGMDAVQTLADESFSKLQAELS